MDAKKSQRLRVYERAAVERYLKSCEEEQEKGKTDKKVDSALNGSVLTI